MLLYELLNGPCTAKRPCRREARRSFAIASCRVGTSSGHRLTFSWVLGTDLFLCLIGIGRGLATPLLPHHRTYGSRIRLGVLSVSTLVMLRRHSIITSCQIKHIVPSPSMGEGQGEGERESSESQRKRRHKSLFPLPLIPSRQGRGIVQPSKSYSITKLSFYSQFEATGHPVVG